MSSAKFSCSRFRLLAVVDVELSNCLQGAFLRAARRVTQYTLIVKNAVYPAEDVLQPGTLRPFAQSGQTFPGYLSVFPPAGGSGGMFCGSVHGATDPLPARLVGGEPVRGVG